MWKNKSKTWSAKRKLNLFWRFVLIFITIIEFPLRGFQHIFSILNAYSRFDIENALSDFRLCVCVWLASKNRSIYEIFDIDRLFRLIRSIHQFSYKYTFRLPSRIRFGYTHHSFRFIFLSFFTCVQLTLNLKIRWVVIFIFL